MAINYQKSLILQIPTPNAQIRADHWFIDKMMLNSNSEAHVIAFQFDMI